MAYGICYTQSGGVKKYEPEQLGSIPTYITGYTVGYPSTAYYPDMFYFGPNFYCFAYPGPPSFPMYPGFTEGTAEYIYNISPIWIDSYTNTNDKIYNFMSYTLPDGYVLDKNGDYTYTAEANIYTYNVDVKYGNAINTINTTKTIYKEFHYKKKDKLDTYIKYYVTLSLNNGMLNCKCNSVTNIPGTNNGNVTLGIDIELSDGIGSTNNEHIYFSWVMKDGINESKSCSRHYYSGSGFTTQSSWENDNGDGTKTHYTFHINHDSIPSRPNSKSL